MTEILSIVTIVLLLVVVALLVALLFRTSCGCRGFNLERDSVWKTRISFEL